MEKKRIILPSKRYFKSPEEDLTIRLNLDEQKNLLREGDKDIVLDINELFNKERNDSVNYKIYGKLKMIFRNNYYGDAGYYYLKNKLYLVGDGSDGDYNGYIPYDEFALLRKDFLREVNVPSSASTITNFTQNIVLSGYTGHTSITGIDAPYQNWNVYLSYVHAKDSTHQMKYTLSGGTSYDFTANDGIPFRVTSNSRYYILTSPVEHGISPGEYITLSTSGNTFYTYSGTSLVTTTNVSGRTFYVESVGNEYYNSEKYVINILKNEIVSGTTFSNVVFGKRCIDKNDITGTTSTYYVHKHKILKSTEDYILDKAGFESPIWEDEKKLLFENFDGDNDVLVERNIMESVLYDFKEPLQLTGITNNLGYTPTEVYVTVIFRNGNGFFEYPPKVGYRFNFHDTWIDEHFSGTTSNETNLTYQTFTGNTNGIGYSGFTFKSGVTLNVGDELFGAFVEYNESELKERVISESFHKIHNPTNIFDYGQTGNTTTFSGATTNNPFGLFYQPHYRIKLRELSPYIEVSDTDDILNLPENAKYYESDGLWKWRDLYDQGFIDQDGNGVNHPFINNTHYVKNDINFYLRNEADFTNKSDGIKKFRSDICSVDEITGDAPTP